MKIWHVHFDVPDDGVGDNTFHTTEESARLYYCGAMIAMISCGDEDERRELEDLTIEELESRCEETGFVQEREVHEYKNLKEVYTEYD